MQKNKKQSETKKPVPPSKSGVRRGEKEESKVGKILTTVGVSVLVALVFALVIALIVVSVANKKPKESPFIDEIHVNYQEVSDVINHQLVALNEKESSRKAFNELTKPKSFIIFYRDEDLKNEEFVEAALALKSDSVGVVFYNLTNNPEILGESDAVLNKIEFSDPKLLPFVIEITESQYTFRFIGEMENVLAAIRK
ncbi:MAG: hypothetical protein ACOX56_06935 [Acholeplasmataceae bacterium]